MPITVPPGNILNAEAVEVEVSGPTPYNRLYLCTGTVVFEFTTNDPDDWLRDTLTFLIPALTFSAGAVDPTIAVTGALASVYADNHGGWAVDRVAAEFDGPTGQVRVTAHIAVRGHHAHFNRMAYQVSFLAVAPPVVHRWIYVADSASTSADTIFVYPLDANGDVAPTCTLHGPTTQINGPAAIALDASRNVYVANAANSTITVYPPDADGDTAPIRILGGSLTSIAIPDGLAFDSAGNLYVLSQGGTIASPPRNVAVFPPGASGNVPPNRLIMGPSTGIGQASGIGLDASDTLYIAQWVAPTNILVFASGANGDVAPIRIIQGPNTNISGVAGVALDAAGNLYAAGNDPVNGEAILVFAPGENGNAVPIRTIAGSSTNLNIALGLAVDSSGAAYAVNNQGNSVTVYAPGANGNTAPVRTIAGPATRLAFPSPMTVEG